MKKFENAWPKLIRTVVKYQMFLFFTKLRYYKKPEQLNETIIVDEFHGADQTMY